MMSYKWPKRHTGIAGLGAGLAMHVSSLLVMSAPALASDEPAVARFTWSDGQMPPHKMYVAPAKTRIGEVVAVIVEMPPQAILPPADALQVDVSWLVPALKAPLPDLGGLPAAAGPRLVVPMRIYHLGPWQAAWGDGEAGEVMMAAGRLSGPQEIMPVRDPRAIGGIPRWALWVVAFGAGALAWVLLRRRLFRRRSGFRLADRNLPPPAWLTAAVHLQELDRTGAAGAQAGRVFLDRLAHILRTYMQGRYHLPALEMTASEIMAAGRDAGWPAEHVDGFCAMLTACDHQRYAPQMVTALSCQQIMRTALDLIEDVRIEPVWSPVPPGHLSEAAAAWRNLRARYPRQTSSMEREAC